jgi:hypothetical protein
MGELQRGTFRIVYSLQRTDTQSNLFDDNDHESGNKAYELSLFFQGIIGFLRYQQLTNLQFTLSAYFELNKVLTLISQYAFLST